MVSHLSLVAVVISCCFVGTTIANTDETVPVIIVPLFGRFEDLFMYYTYMTINGRNYSVVVDTGSSDLLIPDVTCTSCDGDKATFYDPTKSSNFEPIYCNSTVYNCKTCHEGNQYCDFQEPYVGITETATAVSDLVTLGAFQQRLPFGAITAIKSQAKSATGIRYEAKHSLRTKQWKLRRVGDDFPVGMFGISYQNLSSYAAPTFLDALVQGQGAADKFSICLKDSGGAMVVGGSRLPADQYSYTPSPSTDFYRFTLQSISVEMKDIGVSASTFNSTNCIVDTGTPVPTMDPSAYAALQATFVSNCTNSNLKGVCGVPKGASLFDQKCFNMTENEISQFPTVRFHLPGVTLEYTPKDYLLQMYFCNPGELGLGFSTEQGWTVIGARLLAAYDVVYDRVDHRLGFGSKENCNA